VRRKTGPARRLRRDDSSWSKAEILTALRWNSARIILAISNGNRTEWSPIWLVIIRVITKSDDRAAGVRFVDHGYDYRPNWTTRSLITS